MLLSLTVTSVNSFEASVKSQEANRVNDGEIDGKPGKNANLQGRRAKTDAQDPLLLAQYGAQGADAAALWHPLPSLVSDLEQLLHQRDEVEPLLRRERTR